MLDDRSRRYQTAIAVGTMLLALAMGYVALSIPSDAGYAGVGPNFLPWVVNLMWAFVGCIIGTAVGVLPASAPPWPWPCCCPSPSRSRPRPP
jgi:hypothetical protein